MGGQHLLYLSLASELNPAYPSNSLLTCQSTLLGRNGSCGRGWTTSDPLQIVEQSEPSRCHQVLPKTRGPSCCWDDGPENATGRWRQAGCQLLLRESTMGEDAMRYTSRVSCFLDLQERRSTLETIKSSCCNSYRRRLPDETF